MIVDRWLEAVVAIGGESAVRSCTNDGLDGMQEKTLDARAHARWADDDYTLAVASW